MAGVSREEFLKAVRKAIGRRIPSHSHHAGPMEGEVGRLELQGTLADTFVARAEEAGMRVHRVPDVTGARAAVAEIIRTEEATRVLTWATPLVDELELGSALAGEGVSVERWDPGLPEDERKAKAFAMSCGVTGVDYAVAETGSLVLCASPEKGRSVSLLGKTHIAVVRADQILPDLYDLFPRIMADYPDGLPGNITLITGPSKTADIELQLVIGVHGPGTVHIVVIEP